MRWAAGCAKMRGVVQRLAMTSLREAQVWASTARPDDTMKRLKKNQSGALGDIVASRNRFGEYDRERVSPKHPRTVSQLGS